MLCEVCRKNNATVHLTEIVNEKIVEMYICQDCAQSKANELNEKFNMSGLLGSLAADVEAVKKKQAIKCPVCGLNYTEFKKRGRLGCAGCYAAFKYLLLPLLKKIHSSVHHSGKAPLGVDKKVYTEIKIEELKQQLQRSIQLEEYEQAARLRDKIQKLEKNK